MEETAKVLDLVYEKMCTELEERYARWVDQNWAMRGMELAKTQIESKGDTYVDYAMALLDGGYNRLKAVNSKERKELSDLEAFIIDFTRKVEDVAGIKLDRKKMENATNVSNHSTRKLPPLPF